LILKKNYKKEGCKMKKLAKALWIEKNEGVYVVGPTAELQDDVVAGDVVEYNKKAEEEPTVLNSADPKESWFVKLTNVDEAEFNKLPDYK